MLGSLSSQSYICADAVAVGIADTGAGGRRSAQLQLSSIWSLKVGDVAIVTGIASASKVIFGSLSSQSHRRRRRRRVVADTQGASSGRVPAQLQLLSGWSLTVVLSPSSQASPSAIESDIRVVVICQSTSARRRRRHSRRSVQAVGVSGAVAIDCRSGR